MSRDPRQFIVRRPRHSALHDDPGVVWLERPSCERGEPLAVTLVDFSRQGAKFELNSLLAPGERIVVRVRCEAAGLDVQLPAQVRWQQAGDQGTWKMGCVFDEEVSYEVVGELFLNGILSTEGES